MVSCEKAVDFVFEPDKFDCRFMWSQLAVDVAVQKVFIERCLDVFVPLDDGGAKVFVACNYHDGVVFPQHAAEFDLSVVQVAEAFRAVAARCCFQLVFKVVEDFFDVFMGWGGLPVRLDV